MKLYALFFCIVSFLALGLALNSHDMRAQTPGDNVEQAPETVTIENICDLLASGYTIDEIAEILKAHNAPTEAEKFYAWQNTKEKLKILATVSSITVILYLLYKYLPQKSGRKQNHENDRDKAQEKEQDTKIRSVSRSKTKISRVHATKENNDFDIPIYLEKKT